MPGTLKNRKASPLQIALLGVLVLALWAGALVMPMPQARKPLTMAVGMWPGAETFMLARDAGELPRGQVNLVEMSWASAAMRAVGNRVVDATLLSLDEVVRQMSQGYPLRIVLVTDVSRGADAVLAPQRVTEARQLAGLRIGYEPRTAASVILERCLKEGGLTWEQVTEVPINPAEADDSVGELILGAVALSEPWIQRLRHPGLRPVYDSSQPNAEVVRVLVVHEAAVKERREEVGALVKAHLKWMPKLATLGEELEPVLRREGLKREQFLAVLKKLEVPDVTQNKRWLTGEDPWVLQRMEMLAAQLNLLPASEFDKLRQALDPSFVMKESP
jgi:NitT/TauT family transport system substrate-binding protein